MKNSAPINFCHISPTQYLPQFTTHNGAHLILAHLVEQDEQYASFYANLNDGRRKIMDNSAFEMFKLGRPMYDSAKLVEMGKKCKADVIVMSDYPKEPWKKTVDAAVEMIPQLKAEGFGTFFVPQGQLGDVSGVMQSIKWALSEPNIDLIGVSILTCPIAFRVNESAHGDDQRSDAYKLQRFLSRWKLFMAMKNEGLLDEKAHKRFHCLGMTDGPKEIELLVSAGFADYIYSWDSSAAVWAGINGIEFDQSPSGLTNGKYEEEVDFGMTADLTPSQSHSVYANIQYINKLCLL